MRQRNAGPYPQICPTLQPPVEVPPGGVIDAPELLAGFEPVPDDPPPVDRQPPVSAAKAAGKKPSRAAAPADDAEEATQQ